MSTFRRIAVTALGYVLLGAAGLALAIPPGYASPVFPAAGLAVAAVLCLGPRVLPGIWLGSLVINLFVAWKNGSLGSLSIAAAALLGGGAALQAWVAYRLVQRRQPEKWRLLATEKDIGLFLALAAPLACLVSATVGTAVLCLTGIVPTVDRLFFWWNWWLGDVLGVLTFTPITLVVLLRGASPWKERFTTVALPMLVALAVVTVIFLTVSRWELRQQVAQIEDSGEKIARLLDHRLVAHQEALSSLRRLIEVTPAMTYRQFEYFTRITLQDNRDIFALSFNPYLRHVQRPLFEQSMAQKYMASGFNVTERNGEKKIVVAGERPYYVPVGYIAPLSGNQAAVGYDIYSDPVRRSAIEQAMNFMKPAVTEPIQLVQEQQKRVGVLVLHPAYQEQHDPLSGKTVSQLTGFAVAVIKVDDMVRIATRDQVPDGLVFRMRDPQAEPDRQLLFASDSGQNRPVAPYLWQTRLTMADRLWSLEVFPTAAYLNRQRSWLAWGVGIAGLLFATLFQMILLAMTGRNAAVQHQVNQQTLELTKAKEQLEFLNRSLQQQVEETVAELRQKDQVLISQGRQAAMGEMIGNIAHQWRQPLNALSMLITNIQFAQMNGELTREYLDDAAATANRLIQKMSTTINDFRNFFNPDKAMVSFSALQQVRAAVELVEAAFKNHGISIEIAAGNDCLLMGFPNEYSQVLLNLLNNAKDAILETGARPGRISISLGRQEGMGTVTVLDNGGGIPDEVRDKIFEPYFSTKNMGTGIGLYMSKMIIERNMNGRLSVQNSGDGCSCTVFTPLGEP